MHWLDNTALGYKLSEVLNSYDVVNDHIESSSPISMSDNNEANETITLVFSTLCII